MSWITLLLALAAFAGALLTASVALMVVLLLAALGLLLASAMAFYARPIGELLGFDAAMALYARRVDARRREAPAAVDRDPR